MKKIILICSLLFISTIATTILLLNNDNQNEDLDFCQAYCTQQQKQSYWCLAQCFQEKKKSNNNLPSTLNVVQECRYEEIVGQATITQINPAPPKPHACLNQPMEVKFDFMPLEQQLGQAQTDKDQLLILSNAMDPTISFLERHQIKVGQAYKVVQQRLQKGSNCAPTIYTFFDIDLTDYQDDCQLSNKL